MFESGAILLYLAEKAGKLLPRRAGPVRALEWMFFQVGNTGPMLGQAHHFRTYSGEKSSTPSTATPTKASASMAWSTSGCRR